LHFHYTCPIRTSLYQSGHKFWAIFWNTYWIFTDLVKNHWIWWIQSELNNKDIITTFTLFFQFENVWDWFLNTSGMLSGKFSLFYLNHSSWVYNYTPSFLHLAYVLNIFQVEIICWWILKIALIFNYTIGYNLFFLPLLSSLLGISVVFIFQYLFALNRE
jgi:hypothetical protein